MLAAKVPGVKLYGNHFYRFSLKKNGVSNQFIFKKTSFMHTHIFLSGNENKVHSLCSQVTHSTISITGSRNTIFFDENTEIRGVNIIIRGNNCLISIGKKTTIGGARFIHVGSDCSITIGDNCLLADNIEIWASDTHSIFDAQGNMSNEEKSIHIGNSVWIGSHVKILKGVSVGNGSIIGMGSVVTRNIPSHVVSVGNPNRTVKKDISWLRKYRTNRACP